MDNDAQYSWTNGYIVVLQSAIILQMEVYTWKYIMYFQWGKLTHQIFSVIESFKCSNKSFGGYSSMIVYNVSVLILRSLFQTHGDVR